MENRSFEGDSTSGSPPKNHKENPSGPSEPLANSSGKSKEQAKEIEPPLARISDDEDESPPAYIKRYLPEEKLLDDLEDLEPPPPTDPVQEPHDDRNDPELQRRASDRKKRREMQRSTEGLCSLRPDPPNLRPLPPIQPYSDFDSGQQAANAPDPLQQAANVPNPLQQVTNASDPLQQAANAPDPLHQEVNESDQEQQAANASDPLLQEANASDQEQQEGNAPDNAEQLNNAPALSVSCCERFDLFYESINTFTFQFPFHTLLLTWPLATGILGVMSYNKEFCRMNDVFPWLMMAVGLYGSITIIMRLYAIYYERQFQVYSAICIWLVVRILEFILWILVVAQLYYFFKQSPSYSPGEAHYCKRRIYFINCVLMFLAAAAMLGWVLVNVEKFIYRPRRQNQRSNT